MLFVLCSAFPVGIHGFIFNRDTPPTMYKASDPIVVTVGALRSPFRPVPISYEIDDLFCPLLNSPPTSISPGQSLTGDVRLPSPYTFRIAESLSCNITCTKQYNDTQKKRLINLIDAGYRASFFLDDLPIGTLYMTTINSSILLPGFEIGFVRDGKHFVRNNIQFTVYLWPSGGGLYVSGFDLTGANSNAQPKCFAANPEETAIEDSTTIPYTFSVKSVTLANETEAIRNARFVFVNPSLTQRVLVTSAPCIGLSVLVVVLVLCKAGMSGN
jgi:hypothetical protein